MAATHTGWITCRHIGGGHKQSYRKIDFKRKKDGIPAKIIAIEYDPNRSVFIALVEYKDGEKRYILAPQNITVGAEIMSGTNADIEKTVGNAMPLEICPVGAEIHNVEMVPGQGGKLCRSAGGVAPPSSVRTTARPPCSCPPVKSARSTGSAGPPSASWATATGSTSAGARPAACGYRGIRPTVRGAVAQNPVSHPLGGGEGRSGGGRHPVSKWGVPAKGGKTRNPRKNSSNKIIRRRMTVRYGESVVRRK